MSNYICSIGDIMKNWKKTAGLSWRNAFAFIAIVKNWTNASRATQINPEINPEKINFSFFDVVFPRVESRFKHVADV